MNLISSIESDLMLKACNYSSIINDLQALLNQWEDQNFNVANGEGVLSKATICLVISSTEYWASNSILVGEVVSRITPAHADVGGMIIGMAVYAISVDDLNASEVTGVVTAGIVGAVVASSGIAGKIGRFLFGG